MLAGSSCNWSDMQIAARDTARIKEDVPLKLGNRTRIGGELSSLNKNAGDLIG